MSFMLVLSLAACLYLYPAAKPEYVVVTAPSVDSIKNPLLFEANQGQLDPQTRFLLRTPRYHLRLTGKSALITLKTVRPSSAGIGEMLADNIKMSFNTSNTPELIAGEGLSGSSTNYYKGTDPDGWHTHVENYGRVRYQALYAGVDLVFYSNQTQLEYDFIVAPYANPSDIKYSFEGMSELGLNADGELEIETSIGRLIMQAPHAYQRYDGGQHHIDAQYKVDQGQISFYIGDYDESRPLIIDPILTSVSYIGGNSDDWINAVVVDALGNSYVTGKTLSTDFPAIGSVAGAYSAGSDVFVAKYSAVGELLATTIIGSDSTSFAGQQEQGSAISLSSAGGVHVAGIAMQGFPEIGGSSQTCSNAAIKSDAFVAELDSDLVLTYSRCFGGVDNDKGLAVAEDGQGRIWLVGNTHSDDLPPGTDGSATDGISIYSDGFIAVIDKSSSTMPFVGYVTGSANDEIHAIAYSQSDQTMVLAGVTNSYGLPGCAGCNHGQLDVFIAKYHSDFNQAFTRLLGGSLDEGAFVSDTDTDRVGLAVDAAGKIYLSAKTGSGDLDVVGAGVNTGLQGSSDIMLARLTAQGQADYQGYFGGSDSESAGAIAVDSTGGRIVISGTTSSMDLPTNDMTTDLFAYSGGSNDAFVARFNQSMNLNYAFSIGGGGYDSGMGVALHESGAVTVVGQTNSFDWVEASNTNAGGQWDGFIALVSPAYHDLGLSGAGPEGQVASGEVRKSNIINYQFKVTNTGPDTAHSLVLAILLPVQVQLSALPQGCVSTIDVSGVTTLSCEFASLDTDQTQILAFDVIVLIEASFTVDARIDARLGSVDLVPINNEIHIDASPASPFVVRSGFNASNGNGGGLIGWVVLLLLSGLNLLRIRRSIISVSD